MKQMGLSETPLGEAKTKATSSDYHKNEPPVAVRQAEVGRDYLKRAARIDELNGHSPGSDGPMVTALKRYNGGAGAGLRDGRVRGDVGGTHGPAHRGANGTAMPTDDDQDGHFFFNHPENFRFGIGSCDCRID